MRQTSFLLTASLVLSLAVAHTQTKPRARDLGVPFDGTPGALNAITDVAGVEVGMTTLISERDRCASVTDRCERA